MRTMAFLQKDWLALLFLVFPFVLAMILWNTLPDQIVVQWSLSGDIGRMESKTSFLVMMGGVSIFVYLLLRVLPTIDPKASARHNKKPLRTIRIITGAFFCVIFSASLLYNAQVPIDIGLLGKIALPLLFLVLGNLFSKLRANYFVGIRTPWTLESKEVWIEPHRLAGGLWVASALFMLLFLFYLPEHLYFVMMISTLGVMTVVPVVYSYILFRKQHSTP